MRQAKEKPALQAVGCGIARRRDISGDSASLVRDEVTNWLIDVPGRSCATTLVSLDRVAFHSAALLAQCCIRCLPGILGLSGPGIHRPPVAYHGVNSHERRPVAKCPFLIQTGFAARE